MKVFSKRIISFETLNISESINFHFLVDEGLKQRVCETFLMEMHGKNGWIFCLKCPVPGHCDLGEARAVRGPQCGQMMGWSPETWQIFRLNLTISVF